MEKETIYIDPVTFHAQRKADATMIPYETSFFIGKCDAFVEGHFVVPADCDAIIMNVACRGEVITPRKPLSELEAAQAQYERDMAELAAAYQEGVNSV